MRLIDADLLEQEIIKRAFEGKAEWNVNDLKEYRHTFSPGRLPGILVFIYLRVTLVVVERMD